MHDVAVVEGQTGPVGMESRPAPAPGERRSTSGAVSEHELTWAMAAEAAGEATPAQLALLDAHPLEWRAGLARLLRQTEADLAKVRTITGPERDQVVADFERERSLLAAALQRLTGTRAELADPRTLDGPGEVRLQASWSDGRVVMWAAGPGTEPAPDEDLGDRLAAVEAPAGGWWPHDPVPLPGGVSPGNKVLAPARAIGIPQALGWLVTVGAKDRPDGVGASVLWLGRVAVWAVDFVARGAIIPTLRAQNGGSFAVAWAPALVDRAKLDALSRAMPGPVAALDRTDPRSLTLDVLGATVDAIVRDAAGRLELPAPPPVVRTPGDVAEAVVTNLNGAPFAAPARLAMPLAERLERWAEPVRGPVDARLVVQLDPPDKGGAWFLSVLGPGQDGRMVPLEVALVDGRSKRHLADETVRLERLLPVLNRPGGQRRGEVVLSQDEAFELMGVTGPSLAAAGFDIRVPALSRRKPRPALRLTAEPVDASVVGAHQLADVRWSAVFDDVELTAEDIRRLAAEARPLIHSRGRWVEIDRVDLNEAAAALAERAHRTRLTGAEVLRHAVGLEHSGLSGGTVVGGTGWAADLLARTSTVSTEAVANPPGFKGTLRSYQAEALAWLGFLDSAGLGGCLALDMGLGKTPTVLAHLARLEKPAGAGTLVIAPPAVVGNWAVEASRFVPKLKVIVHHGASRATAEELRNKADKADVIITTYGTAVRDIDAISGIEWARVVLDEAQAIKNPASDVAQELRRIQARSRLALTGTPVENGLGDLWAILDFTNPGLLGPRAAFVSQLSAQAKDGRPSGEHALRALNGILVFRRTKAEPEVAAELPDKIDELDHCTMTPEQVGLYQAVIDRLVQAPDSERRQGDILAAITALKQICNHPAAYDDDGRPLPGRSGKLARLEEIVDSVFAAGEKVLVFTHFAEWGKRLAEHLTARTGVPTDCYHGGLSRGVRDRMIADFQARKGQAALVLSLKAGGTGLNLTAASHVVLYDRWWNPAVEDQARDRAWRIGQERTVISHRLVCPGTVDERVEDVVAGKRHIADLVLPKSSSLADLDPNQLRVALGLRPDELLTADAEETATGDQEEAA